MWVGSLVSSLLGHVILINFFISRWQNSTTFWQLFDFFLKTFFKNSPLETFQVVTHERTFVVLICPRTSAKAPHSSAEKFCQRFSIGNLYVGKRWKSMTLHSHYSVNYLATLEKKSKFGAFRLKVSTNSFQFYRAMFRDDAFKCLFQTISWNWAHS